MRLSLRASSLLSFVVLPITLSCGSSNERAAIDVSDAGRGAPDASAGGTGDFGGGATDAAVRTDDGCSDAARLVYVLSDAFDLYSFDPSKLTFTKIGKLQCGGASPNSMAVDRDGTAWVNYSDGLVYKVSTKDASCQPTTYDPFKANVMRMGMAFASDSTGSKAETLYIVALDGADQGKGLWKMDRTAMTVSAIGDFSGTLAGKGAELTGPVRGTSSASSRRSRTRRSRESTSPRAPPPI